MTLALLVLGLAIGLLLRLPIAVAILIPSLIYMLQSPTVSLSTLVSQMSGGVDSFILLAVPLFVLVGNLMNASHATDRLFEWIQALVGHYRGALGYANVVGSFVFAGMSGAAVADAAGLGSVEVKAMRKHGYPDRFSIGLTAASTTIGPILPPSIPAVVYGAAAGVPVGALFIGGIGPGILMAIFLIVWVAVASRIHDFPREQRSSLKKIGWQTLRALPALATPFVLLAGIFAGVFTATEAAGVAVAYVVLIGVLVYRSLGWAEWKKALRDSVETTVAILIIVASSSIFGYILALERAPTKIVSIASSIGGGQVISLLLICLSLLVVGTLLEPLAAIVILTPVLAPLASTLGIHPVQLGIIVILSLMIGLLTPPVGMVLFTLTSVTDVPFREVWRGTMPFLLPLLLCLLLVVLFPPLTLFFIGEG